MMLIIRDYNKTKMVTHSKKQESSQKTLFIGNKDKNIASFMLEGDRMDTSQLLGLIFIQSKLLTKV